MWDDPGVYSDAPSVLHATRARRRRRIRAPSRRSVARADGGDRASGREDILDLPVAGVRPLRLLGGGPRRYMAASLGNAGTRALGCGDATSARGRRSRRSPLVHDERGLPLPARRHMRLDGSRTLVTGAASGIGLATA